MNELIVKLYNLFKKENIRWAIGGSKLLSFYNITDIVHDLDLNVALEDHEKVCEILESLGHSIEVPNKKEYLTEKFSRFSVDDIEIDVMSNFKIKHDGGVFNFELDDDITELVKVKQYEIPVTSLEQWYIVYQLMKEREEKVKMIEKYFLETKKYNKDLLIKYTDQSFSKDILTKVQNLLLL